MSLGFTVGDYKGMFLNVSIPVTSYSDIPERVLENSGLPLEKMNVWEPFQPNLFYVKKSV